MNFSFSDILFLFLLFLLLFVSIFLFTADKGKRISNILLGLFFLAICFNLADSFLLLKQFYMQFPQWALWGSSMLLACGPLLYFYVRCVLYKDAAYKTSWLLHFIPFLILFVFTEASYLSAGTAKQMEVLQNILNRKLPALFYISGAVIYVHFLAYLIVSFRLVRRYGIAAVNRFSNEQSITLNWLRSLIIFFLLLMVSGTVNNYLSIAQNTTAYFIALSITVFMLLLFIV
ncbi:MAG TPA: hypothetical protein PL045_05655, partial [Chitinophagaceae bacterium]|nr:hypothetical protein [Chitinophagaceae bacterium]